MRYINKRTKLLKDLEDHAKVTDALEILYEEGLTTITSQLHDGSEYAEDSWNAKIALACADSQRYINPRV